MPPETYFEVQVEETSGVEPPTVIESLQLEITGHPPMMTHHERIACHVQGDEDEKLDPVDTHKDVTSGFLMKEAPLEVGLFHLYRKPPVIPVDVLLVEST